MSPSRGTSNRARIATTVLHTEDSIQGKTHFKSSPASYPISLMSFGSAQRQEHNLSGSVWALQLQPWRTCVCSRYAALKVKISTDDWRLHLQKWTEGVSIRTGTGHPEVHAPGSGRDCWHANWDGWLRGVLYRICRCGQPGSAFRSETDFAIEFVSTGAHKFIHAHGEINERLA